VASKVQEVPLTIKRVSSILQLDLGQAKEDAGNHSSDCAAQIDLLGDDDHAYSPLAPIGQQVDMTSLVSIACLRCLLDAERNVAVKANGGAVRGRLCSEAEWSGLRIVQSGFSAGTVQTRKHSDSTVTLGPSVSLSS
jgi:hypothetical protein